MGLIQGKVMKGAIELHYVGFRVFFWKCISLDSSPTSSKLNGVLHQQVLDGYG